MSADFFFTSYARADADRPLQKFIKALRAEVRRISGLNLTEDQLDQLGFFDTTSIQTGDEWRKVLGAALRTCKVCVCLCSPTYFNRLYCGKEYQVFQDRRRAWLGRPGNDEKPARVIVPVLWVVPRDPLPDGVSLFQNDENDYPSSYREQGLRTLADLKNQRDNFLKVVRRLAEVVWAAVRDVQLPELEEIPAFEKIPSAFHRPTRYGLVVVSLHEKGGDWRPFANGFPVDYEAESVASQLRSRMRTLPNDDALVAELQNSKNHREAVVLLVSPEGLTSPAVKASLGELEDLGLGNYAVLVAWDGTQGRDEARLKAVLAAASEACPRTFSSPSACHDWSSIVSAGELRRQISRTYEKLRGQLVASDPAVRAADEQLEKAAQEQGIKIDRAPALSSPTGDS
ncbi:MAG: TIR domain-containing protein [Vicinamibacteria bacterium]